VLAAIGLAVPLPGIVVGIGERIAGRAGGGRIILEHVLRYGIEPVGGDFVFRGRVTEEAAAIGVGARSVRVEDGDEDAFVVEERGKIAVSLSGNGRAGDNGGALPQLVLFVVAEEERAVLDDASAHGGAVLVIAQRILDGCEGIACV